MVDMSFRTSSGYSILYVSATLKHNWLSRRSPSCVLQTKSCSLEAAMSTSASMVDVYRIPRAVVNTQHTWFQRAGSIGFYRWKDFAELKTLTQRHPAPLGAPTCIQHEFCI
ncbi:uncharacterized protein SCHCODRAFT_02369907 [Schizophyllum commune H4-8]|uniref:uncharacterized protein n=1 Tax=Schizophyllum commune (strain H4-8 / FGSC 9210) TaxID=578458 RepID=UPI002160B6DB|nr:uncharacterized protein SCHCODRAFT_02369907 [Schizophyllum commune H4-8]KAI5889531.1 hypothetical protein SCHCODRAFT_02369907 [Schizophyllum commune H4-8]